MKHKAVFLDRDGTIVKDNPYEPNCSSPIDVELVPNAADAIRMLNSAGFKIIVITNQPWVDEGYITEENLHEIHAKMISSLMEAGAVLDDIFYCPHSRDAGCECRKPKIKLISQAVEKHNIDIRSSFVVGDRLVDINLGKNAGCRTILVSNNARKKGEAPDADFVVSDLLEAAQIISRGK